MEPWGIPNKVYVWPHAVTVVQSNSVFFGKDGK